MGLQDINFRNHDSEYDREYNLLYLIVKPRIKRGLVKSKSSIDENTISNLAIYDIGNDQLYHFFDKGTTNKIAYYFYETEYNDKLQKMDFNRESRQIFNNTNIDQREKANKLFVVVEKPGTEEYDLWVSSRSAKDKKLVKSFAKDVDWRIDVYNKKILFIQKMENEVAVEALDW